MVLQDGSWDNLPPPDVLSVDNIMLPLLLVGAKILIAPILSEVFVNMLGVEGDLSLFAFIYGTLPTASVPPCVARLPLLRLTLGALMWQSCCVRVGQAVSR